MQFCIQVSNPCITGVKSDDDESLRDAIESIFPLCTEYAFIIWSGVFIPLSYKYDISIMIDDIVRMVMFLSSRTSGQLVVDWASNTFSATWHIDFDDERLSVRSEWRRVIGFTEPLLRSREHISLTKAEFLSEWKALLQLLSGCLYQCGYSTKEIPDLHDLDLLEHHAQLRGQLYSDS